MNRSLLIHYLRAFAAILVVVHHIPLFLNAKGIQPPFDFHFGAWGVDVFFIISGFVMTRSVRAGDGASGFVLRRLFRIAPLYWLLTTVLAMAWYAAPSAFSTFRVSLSDFVHSMLLIPYFDQRGNFRPLISQGWTLAFEMFFYWLIVAALIVRTRYLFPVVVVTLFVGSLLGLALDKSQHADVLVFFTSPIILEFAFGVVVGLSTSKISGQSRAVGAVGLAALLSFFVISGSSDLASLENLGWERVFTWGLAAALLVLGLVLIESRVQIRSIPILSLLGDASYSIYLVHGIGFVLSYRALRLLDIEPGTIGIMCILLLASTGLGVFVHLLVEVPLQRLAAGAIGLSPRKRMKPAAHVSES